MLKAKLDVAPASQHQALQEKIDEANNEADEVDQILLRKVREGRKEEGKGGERRKNEKRKNR